MTLLYRRPTVDSIPDIIDVDHGNKDLRSLNQTPLSESRAASVIGDVYDQSRGVHCGVHCAIR